MPSKNNMFNRDSMQVDKAFKNLIKDVKIEVDHIEKDLISQREITKRIGNSERIKFMIIEDSKLRALKRK